MLLPCCCLTATVLPFEVTAAPEAEALGAHGAAEAMRWRLLDYYGGLDGLNLPLANWKPRLAY